MRVLGRVTVGSEMGDDRSQRAPRGAALIVALLLLASIFNFVDRTLIFILFPLIKAEMKLSELQLSLLGSTSFAIFYMALGLPFGRLSDRVPRTKLLAAGLLLWSAASFATGLMHDFYGLFFCRVLVGVGEATFAPCAASLVADMFAPTRRATINAAFFAGLPVGGGLALLIGGVLAPHGWRTTFFICSAPGVLIALLIALQREPPRGANHTVALEAIGPTLRKLVRMPGLLIMMLGYGTFIIAAQSLQVWMPSFFSQVHHLSLPQVGRLTGLINFFAGVPGVLGAGWLSDRLRRRGPGGRMRFTALLSLAAAPLWIWMLNTRTLDVALVIYAVLTTISLGFLGPSSADVQDRVGPNQRGIAAALSIFCGNLLGSVIGPPIIGKLSDVLNVTAHPEMRRLSLLVCPAAALLSALVIYAASRIVERDEHAA
jgi:MFS transporter, Spinster family, sphingosine-1-phosphate transporter